MVKTSNSSSLYEDFLEEKQKLDSTLSTIELLQDEKALKEIKEGLDEINEGKTKEFSFDEIDSL